MAISYTNNIYNNLPNEFFISEKRTHDNAYRQRYLVFETEIGDDAYAYDPGVPYRDRTKMQEFCRRWSDFTDTEEGKFIVEHSVNIHVQHYTNNQTFKTKFVVHAEIIPNEYSFYLLTFE